MAHFFRSALALTLTTLLTGCATPSGSKDEAGSGAIEARFSWDRAEFERIVMTAEIDGSTLVKDGSPPGLAAIDVSGGTSEMIIKADLYAPDNPEPTVIEQSISFEVKSNCTNLLTLSLLTDGPPTFALDIKHECQARIINALSDLQTPPDCPTPNTFPNRLALQSWADRCNTALSGSIDSLAEVTGEVRAGGDLVLVNCLNDRFAKATVLMRTSKEMAARTGEDASDIRHDAESIEFAIDQTRAALLGAKECL